jgi:hypothetical protein
MTGLQLAHQGPDHWPTPPGHDSERGAIPDAGTPAMDDHATGNAAHHVQAALHHDLLV